MQITIVQTLDQLDDIREVWAAFQRKVGSVAPNVDPVRFAATVRALGRDAYPYVVVLWRQRQVCALLVGRMSWRRHWMSIGHLEYDGGAICRVLDVVYKGVLTDGSDHSLAAVREHLHDLLGRGIVTSIRFNHLHVDQVPHVCRSQRCSVAKTDLHWQLQLAQGTGPGHIASLSKKHRYNVRRADRLLCEHFDGDVRLRLFTTAADVTVFLRGITELAGKTYQASLGVGVADTALWREILGTEAQAGRLRCYWLEAKGRPIAYQAGALYEDTYFLEAMAYDATHAKLSPGSVLHVRVMADLSGQGVSAVDYGFGDAEYKRLYGTASWQECSVTLYPSNWTGLVRWLAARSRRAIMAGTIRLLASIGQTKRVKSIWRDWLRKRAPSAVQPAQHERP